MDGFIPFVSDEESVFELCTLVFWVLILIVGLGGAAGVGCVVGLIWSELHPR